MRVLDLLDRAPDATRHEVLAELCRGLDAAGVPHGPLRLARSPQRHARSTIYLVADDERPRAPRWVLKQPDVRAAQEDLAQPLTAADQFRALCEAADHLAPLAPELRVSRPVALLPGASAFAMEYVGGVALEGMLRPGSVVRPGPLLRGIAASARFLHHLHELDPPRAAMVRPRAIADEVLALAEDSLEPAGIPLPRDVRAALEAVPPGRVDAQMVRLHGDFAPVNMIADARGHVTGIDIDLCRVGLAEEDLARFLMMLSTARFFLAGADVSPIRALRLRAEATLLRGYCAGAASTSLMLELCLIRQICRRWLYRQAAREETLPPAHRLRKRAVDRCFERLLRERAAALAPAGPVLAQAPSP